MNEKVKCILYVDDDAEDREFLGLALQGVHAPVRLQTAENGLEALAYLSNAQQTQLPCLIVLDLNMPYLDGTETFRRIKADDRLQKVPVMILSSSSKPKDKSDFAHLGIEYFTKPDHMDQFKHIASRMVELCRNCES